MKTKSLEKLKNFEKKKEKLSNLKGGYFSLAETALTISQNLTSGGTYTETLSNGATCTGTCSGDYRTPTGMRYFNDTSECGPW